jgi:hypothetical protein
MPHTSVREVIAAARRGNMEYAELIPKVVDTKTIIRPSDLIEVSCQLHARAAFNFV